MNKITIYGPYKGICDQCSLEYRPSNVSVDTLICWYYEAGHNHCMELVRNTQGKPCILINGVSTCIAHVQYVLREVQRALNDYQEDY